MNLTANNVGVGKSNVTCIPAAASGPHSVASGRGVSRAVIGQENKFSIQCRDRFDNDIKEGGAQVVGAITAPSGKSVPIVVTDNKDGTYSCVYPDVTESGVHSLLPTLNGEGVKNSPFKLKIDGIFNFFFRSRAFSLF